MKNESKKPINIILIIFLITVVSFVVRGAILWYACVDGDRNKENTTSTVVTTENTTTYNNAQLPPATTAEGETYYYNSDYTTTRRETHDCYVCGESGASSKVGSYWYCSTHAAYVRAFSDDSYTTTTKRYSSNGSYSSGVTGSGGYDMPNESDDSFADYVKRVDPDLYNDMLERYESLQ